MFDTKKLEEFVFSSPGNYVQAEYALAPGLVGMRYFDAPILGVAAADDPLFTALKRREAIGEWFRAPKEWMKEAKSVVSFFLPYSQAVKDGEDVTVPEPSPGWLHARIEGNAFLNEVTRFLCRELETQGYHTVIPSLSSEFFSVWKPGSSDRISDPTAGFTSVWSERHIAYVCGLGTFGLSRGLITEKGVCGRFGSFVTDAPLPVTERKYSEIYEYCTRCGLCAAHCPVHAIDPVRGKDHLPCGDRINATKAQYAPRYGCAKCQIDVPCMSGIPNKG